MKITIDAEKTIYFYTEVEVPNEVVEDDGICHWISQNYDNFDWKNVGDGFFDWTEYEEQRNSK